ncbi:uncharacterized protein LOC62_02G001858 [Vanrija pseudolonga]|uniref:Uncharacterized protein n=1 Tax=Vanrija pseudolonga TaxID=143232 RepID=A0AAF1BFN5_9TREE|nr:hypothetical protein LOC62_02G001858 [Vanrija pseudolonga]
MSGTLTSGDCYTSTALDTLDACCTLTLGTFTNQTYADYNTTYPGALSAADANTSSYIGRCDFDDNGNRMSDCLKQRAGDLKVWCTYASGARHVVSTPALLLLAVQQIESCCAGANGLFLNQNASTFRATNPQGYAWFSANGTTVGADIGSCVAYTTSAPVLLNCVKGNISDEHNFKCSSTVVSAADRRLSTPLLLTLLGLVAGTVLAL